MVDQLSFASLDFAAKKKRTKRDVCLAEMAAVVPWEALGQLAHVPLRVCPIDGSTVRITPLSPSQYGMRP